MGGTACTEPQCLYKGDLHLLSYNNKFKMVVGKDSFSEMYVYASGPGSSVGIATGYRLDGPRIESR